MKFLKYLGASFAMIYFIGVIMNCSLFWMENTSDPLFAKYCFGGFSMILACVLYVVDNKELLNKFKDDYRDYDE